MTPYRISDPPPLKPLTPLLDRRSYLDRAFEIELGFAPVAILGVALVVAILMATNP